MLLLKLSAGIPAPNDPKELAEMTWLDAGAMMEYFAPLKQWLDEQNKGKKVGWTTQ